MANASKTVDKQRKVMPKGKPFVKGDPRINRNGRPPNNPAELNALLDEIFMEVIEDAKGNRMGKLRVALNKILLGKNPTGTIHLLDRRYGKVQDRVDVTSLGTKIGSDDVRSEILGKLARIATATGADQAPEQSDK